MELDSGGVATASYIYGPNVNEILAIKRGGQRYFYHQDGNTNVVALSSESGTQVESYRYDAFGLPDRLSSVGNPVLFAGRFYDPETGLYDNRARYYDPRLGRFLSPDP